MDDLPIVTGTADPANTEKPAKIKEEEPREEYKPNRRQRRSKGIKIGMHTMRQWHARSIMDKLFAQKDANRPVTSSEEENRAAASVDAKA
jgi:hypothetical protein